MAKLQKDVVSSAGLSELTNQRNKTMAALSDSGSFRVESVRATTAVENYTKALQKQDVTFRGWRKNAELRNDVLREQYRLQKMSTLAWSEDGHGRINADMIIPREVPARLGSWSKSIDDVIHKKATLKEVIGEMNMRLGLMNQGIQSASRNMINWGKNTQWAGRQMMVGLTIPMAAFAAGSGMLAYQVDQELTRILKVYDYATDNLEAEGERIRDISMQTANVMSRTYGQSAKDTAGIIADLAATGKTGNELQQSAMLVSRASMLGELDRQDAIKTTISLQTVFNQNTQELGETFDYLNALENSTSLSMRDMTVAIPKLSGVVKALGGDYKDMGLMMTAAKSAGIEAAEGANMLKTVMFRAVSPYGRGAETFLAKTGTDLKQLVASTEGKAIPTFLKMGQVMRDANLSQPDRTAVLKDVFGVYQGSKAGQFLEELSQMNDETTQTYAAAQVGMKSTTELAATAAQEVARMQESASGRFKIALETIKTEMAEAGEPFLKVATTILGWLTKVIAGFNGLNDKSKGILLFIAAIAAIVGPVTMVTGVLFTLIGTGIKMIAMLTSLGARYRAVTADQAAQTLLQKNSILPFHDQATAAHILATQLKDVNIQLQTMAGNQAIAARSARAAELDAIGMKRMAEEGLKPRPTATPLPAPVGGVLNYPKGHPKQHNFVPKDDIAYRQEVANQQFLASVPQPDKGGRYQYPAGSGKKGFVPKSDTQFYDKLAADQERVERMNRKVADSADDVAVSQVGVAGAVDNTTESTGKARRSFGAWTGTMAASAGMLLMLTGSTNKFVNALSLGLMSMPLILPVLQKMAAAKVFESWAVGVSAAAGRIKTWLMPALLGARSAAAGIAAALSGPLGWALAAAGVALTVMLYKLRKTREEAEHLAGAGEGIMRSMEIQPLQESESITDTENSQLDKFRRTEEDSAKALKRMGDRFRETKSEADKLALTNSIIQIGLEVYDASGDVNKAKQAIDVAMAAAGMKDGEIKIHFTGSEMSIENMRQQVTDALAKGAAENDKSGWGQWLDFGVSEEMEVKLEAEAKRLNQMFSQVQAGLIDPDKFKDELERVQQTFVALSAQMVEGFMGNFSGKEVDVFKKFGIDPEDSNAVAQGLLTNVELVRALRAASVGSGSNEATRAAMALEPLIQNNQHLVEVYAESVGLENTQKKGIYDLTQVHKDFAGEAKNTTRAVEGFADENGNATGSVETLEQAVGEAGETFKKMKDAAREVMGEVSEAIFERAADQIENQHDAVISGMEAAGERRVDAIDAEAKKRNAEYEAGGKALAKAQKAEDKNFDRDWKVRTDLVEGGYDKRVKAIEATMEAEEKAERLRQKMFEAEKARISRLAEMYNTNVDFNVALNSGDLDEAAKLTNNMRAQEQQWGLDDAEALTGDAAEQRREKQQAEIDKIQEAKKVRLDALQEEQDRAKEMLDERQTAEKEALDAAKQRYNDDVASRKKAEQDKTKAATDGAKARFDAEKKSLDMALAAEKKFIPATQKELQEHTARIQAIYKDHGFQLDMASDEWSTYVAQAMKSAGDAAKADFENTARWGQLGQDIGGEISKGLLGMSFEQFISWMRTGIVPEQNTSKPNLAKANPRIEERTSANRQAAAVARRGTRRGTGMTGGQFIAHGGGPIGEGNRAGRPLTAGLYQDEVPTILQRGEFVFQKKAVQRFGIPALLKMNNGDVGPDHTGRMHNGGFVGGLGGIIQAGLTQGLEAAMFMGSVNNIRNGAQLPPSLSAFMASGQQVAGVPAEQRANYSVDKLLNDLSGIPAAVPPGADGFASWLTDMQRRVRPEVISRVWEGLAMIPGRQFITSGLRPGATVKGSGRPSLHGIGKAVDIHALARSEGGSLADEAMGDRIAQVFKSGIIPGVSEVLWKTNQGGNHFNHVHVGFRHGGGEVGIPGLKVGGDIRYDNTIANLHKNEKVLTAPLASSLERGIQNLDSGGVTKYDISMDLRGALIREEVDIEGAVYKAITKHESKMGRKRVIGDK